ncbi:hypothetical protein [Streptomyces sp. NBC_00582]|uniref:hypothetical protein n=1 Tax=Streptomyces sp. NBC_00582 TaxID=2975783 RepID=UPI002E800C76|nr:hypothetical protein [Streptomyces sp. NBC_00582]WUB61547.1 hypothetical protein OG852_14665 [Streptomyces sp. NBC_00582]
MTFAPRTWVVGEVVTAALLNQEIRDQFNSIFAAWTNYTPTWTASTTNPVLNNGTITGRYMKIGRTVLSAMTLTCGSTTTYGSGTYSFGVPTAAAASGIDMLGTARLTAGSTYIGQCSLGSGASAMNATFPLSATPASAGNMTPTTPATLASTHILRLTVAYEAAA